MNSTDTILQARAGMYSSDLLEVDIYNKKYTHHEFDYLKEYPVIMFTLMNSMHMVLKGTTCFRGKR